MSLKLIQILQIITSVLLMLAILFQGQGAGIGGIFGGGGGGVYRTKRGVEKILFWSTIVLATIFIGLGLLGLFVFKH